MLKSMVAEFPLIRATVVDISSAIFSALSTISYLDFICSLDSPEAEYSIDSDGLYIHSLSPCEPSVGESLVGSSTPPQCVLALGGARGITVSALELLASKDTSLVLTGRSSIDLPNWYDRSYSAQQLRNRLIQLHQQEGEKFTPASIEAELKALAASCETISTIEKLSDLYASVDYLKVDIRDPNAHNDLLAKISSRDLSIDTIINVAGIIEDSLVVKKTRASFERVLSTKLNALRCSFHVLKHHPVKQILNFASIAGKTGNYGQSDYSAANEIVNAGSWLTSVAYPNLIVNSINWGPWASTGMASPEVNEAFAQKGIIPIPLSLGAECIRSLISDHCALPLEVTVGTYDSSKFATSIFDLQSLSKTCPYIGRHSLSITSDPSDNSQSEIFMLYLDPSTLPYLQSHRKFGHPVFPAALSCTLAAEAFVRIFPRFLHTDHESFIRVTTNVLSGIVFESQAPREFIYEVASTDGVRAECTLKAIHSNRSSYRTTVEVLHDANANRSLIARLLDHQLDPSSSLRVSPADCYANYLFHDGVFEVITEESRIFAEPEIISTSLQSHGTSALLGVQVDLESYLDPSLLDGLLQMGLVILRELYGTSALPNRLVVDIYKYPVLGQRYSAYGRIVDVDIRTSKAFYEAVITDQAGAPLIVLSHSDLTHSTSMID